MRLNNLTFLIRPPYAFRKIRAPSTRRITTLNITSRQQLNHSNKLVVTGDTPNPVLGIQRPLQRPPRRGARKNSNRFIPRAPITKLTPPNPSECKLSNNRLFVAVMKLNRGYDFGSVATCPAPQAFINSRVSSPSRAANASISSSETPASRNQS